MIAGEVPLLRLAFTRHGGLEAAVRAWAIAHPPAQAAVGAVGAVDAERVRYLRDLVLAGGIAANVADRRARVLNWSYIGFAVSTARPPAAIMDAMVDDLLAFARAH